MSYIILYHALCLAVLFLTFWGSMGKNRIMAKSLKVVYLMTALIILSDCGWNILEHKGITNAYYLYADNMVYYIAETGALLAWAFFSVETLGSKLFDSKIGKPLFSVPAAASIIMTLTTPITGYVFTIENGEYVRGSMFQCDTAIKMLYLIFVFFMSCICAALEERKYLRKRFMLLALYCVPVMAGGVLQVSCGLDMNCVAPVLGLAIVYKFGLANEAKDNGDIVKAMAQAYSAAFLINTDNHKVRTIIAKGDYNRIEALTKSMPYEDCLAVSVRLNVMPEDRIRVERYFALDHVVKHLEDKNAYSVIYKTNTGGSEHFSKATFMKAYSDEDRHEIFLGIEMQEIRQLLLREKENLEEEREDFERIKESFTTIIADIIEARDIDSGEHVMRVKSLTQYLCNQVMSDCPEYGLTPLKIRYITNGSALHDIGKIMIPDTILLKPGALTKEEYEIMKTHCEKGCTILDKIPKDLDEDYIRYAKEICRSHHERYDGGGYPDHLVGDEIPISAQIVSLADCFDALTNKRVYKDAISKKEAFEMICEGKCGMFNINILYCLEKVLRRQFADEFNEARRPGGNRR